MRSWVRRHCDIVVMLVLAYVPVITAAPGRIPADTKLYLYLDPGRLMGEAPLTWDPNQFAGWVPHQTILYLWPSGPWYWLLDTIGLPDWLAHRLWIGTLLLCAGLGVRYAARVLGLSASAAAVAAIVYQLSPYVLPYVSRTSVILLPWAALGWIVAFTVKAGVTGRWKPSVIVALLVLTVAGVNATATLMIAPAPIIWLVLAGFEKRLHWRRVAQTIVRIGALSLSVSLWWITKLAMQGKYGAAVLSYSETLQAVSDTSVSTEVSRGLGYWLFYVRDPFIATTTAAGSYLTSPVLIAVGFALLLVGLAGLVVTRWAHRRYAALLVGTGLVLSIGAHPYDDMSLGQSALYNDARSGLSLALRSSTRAVPLLVLGLALATGALVQAASARAPRERVARTRLIASGVVVLLAVLNLPALWTGGYVDDALLHDEDPPDSWQDATDALDSDPGGGRVMQVPGQESAAFRWGYTVDPPLAGLTDRPFITRDWLPLGSPTAMDLFYAFDDRIQSGTLDPEAIAPIARLFGVDTIWLTGDIAFDRFRTARPEPLAVLFDADVPGLGVGTAFGDRVANTPDLPVVDEASLTDPAIGAPLPRVSLVPVDDPEALLRAKTSVVTVAGNGDGVVAAAASGLIDGTELLRYLPATARDERAALLDGSALVVITDSNRARAHHWRSSQDVVGFTEDGSGTDVDTDDIADQRLPVFTETGGTPDPADMTVAEQRGPVRAVASAYGTELWYWPEDRAAMAIDGNTSTAWTVADRGDPIGQSITLQTDEPVPSVRVVQPLDATTNRWISSVRVVADGLDVGVVSLDEASRTTAGQTIDLGTAATKVQLVIESVEVAPRATLTGVDGVGFAEVDAGLGETREVVRLPDVTGIGPDTPVAVVLSRERSRPTDRWRSDPEAALSRAVTLDGDRSFTADVLVRLDQRATDSVIGDLVGAVVPTSDARALGTTRAAAWSAFDADPSTAWTSPFAGAIGSSITVPDVPAGTDRVALFPVTDAVHSAITEITVHTGGASTVVPVDTSIDGERVVAKFPATTAAGDLRIEVTGIAASTTIDRRTFDVVELPVAIREIRLVGVDAAVLPAMFDSGCRTDMLMIDGEPAGLRIAAPTSDLLAGVGVHAELCGRATFDLAVGEHLIETAVLPGLQVDRVVLTSGRPVAPAARPVVTEVSRSRTSRSATVAECPDGCWFVQGEGVNPGWSADLDGSDLGPATIVDGGMSGWWLPPSDTTRTVTTHWSAQKPVDIALVLSALAIIGCLVLLWRDRAPVAVPAESPHRLRRDARVLDRRSAIIWTCASVVVTGVVAGAGVGLAVGIVAAVCLVVVRRPVVAGIVGVAAVAAIALVVVGRVAFDDIPADFRFPGAFSDLHRPMIAAIALVVLSAVCVADRRRP